MISGYNYVLNNSVRFVHFHQYFETSILCFQLKGMLTDMHFNHCPQEYLIGLWVNMNFLVHCILTYVPGVQMSSRSSSASCTAALWMYCVQKMTLLYMCTLLHSKPTHCTSINANALANGNANASLNGFTVLYDSIVCYGVSIESRITPLVAISGQAGVFLKSLGLSQEARYWPLTWG